MSADSFLLSPHYYQAILWFFNQGRCFPITFPAAAFLNCPYFSQASIPLPAFAMPPCFNRRNQNSTMWIPASRFFSTKIFKQDIPSCPSLLFQRKKRILSFPGFVFPWVLASEDSEDHCIMHGPFCSTSSVSEYASFLTLHYIRIFNFLTHLLLPVPCNLSAPTWLTSITIEPRCNYPLLWACFYSITNPLAPWFFCPIFPANTKS